MQIQLMQLSSIYAHLTTKLATIYLPHLNAALAEFEINTPLRVAAFLAQIGHESGELRWWVEFADGKAYEGRKDLGNTQPGDGPRYKGRSPVQLTGRNNYLKAGTALGVDLIAHPERAADADIGFRIAGWFWKTHNLNDLADKQLFDSLTKAINGGYNGKAHRDALYKTAKTVLGIK